VGTRHEHEGRWINGHGGNGNGALDLGCELPADLFLESRVGGEYAARWAAIPAEVAEALYASDEGKIPYADVQQYFE